MRRRRGAVRLGHGHREGWHDSAVQERPAVPAVACILGPHHSSRALGQAGRQVGRLAACSWVSHLHSGDDDVQVSLTSSGRPTEGEKLEVT